MLDVITGITFIIYSGNFMCLQFYINLKKNQIRSIEDFCSLDSKDINRFVDILKLNLCSEKYRNIYF